MRKRDEEDEIRTTIEKTGKKVSESGNIKSVRYSEGVDEAGTVHRKTEVEKGLNDCGHYGETGGMCQLCGSFTICVNCLRDRNFVCDSCRLICCPNCGTESIFHPGVRVCKKCGLKGFIRRALREKK